MLSRAAFYAFTALLLCLTASAHAKYPAGYLVRENTTSPNERYAILIPNTETGDVTDNAPRDFIVDLQTEKTLAELPSDYFAGANHQGLTVEWAEDSSWCVVIHDHRWGFTTINLIELRGGKPKQTPLGNYVRPKCERTISQQAKDPETTGDGFAYAHAKSDTEVVIVATFQTNQKGFDDIPTYCSFFHGTYDLAAAKWRGAQVRPANEKQLYDLIEAYGVVNEDDGTEWANDQEHEQAHDAAMNRVYQALRFVLPADEFAPIKARQLAWLKKRDAAEGAKARIEMLEERLAELRELLW